MIYYQRYFDSKYCAVVSVEWEKAKMRVQRVKKKCQIKYEISIIKKEEEE